MFSYAFFYFKIYDLPMSSMFSFQMDFYVYQGLGEVQPHRRSLDFCGVFLFYHDRVPHAWLSVGANFSVMMFFRMVFVTLYSRTHLVYHERC